MRSLSYTKVTVHLRKSTLRNEWYVYLESYPVYVKDKEGPQRIREYLNRTVSTVIWDKRHIARTSPQGKNSGQIAFDFWRNGKDVVSGPATYKPGDNYNVLPIPKEEIDYCGGVLIQNPGY